MATCIAGILLAIATWGMAMAAARATDPRVADLVRVLDLELGVDSTLPVAQILSDRRIPFAFMTGDVDSPGDSFDDVPALEKPFTVPELRRTLELLLSR